MSYSKPESYSVNQNSKFSGFPASGEGKEQISSTPTSLTKGLLRTIYIIHLVVSAIFSTYLIIQTPAIVSMTITFVMIIIYGYMGVWVLLISFLLVLCKNHQKAAVFTRIITKFIMFCFPIFGLLSISKDNELNNKGIHIFIIYMAIVTFALIIYEIITFFCYEDKYPEFLFRQNDLTQANAAVMQKRKEYNDFIDTH